MKIKIRLFLIISVLFSSCTKVIDVKLNDSHKKYVIEGIITNEPGGCKVLITQTRNFNEENVFSGIGGAVVRINDNGFEISLTETSPGIYEAASVTGTPGHLYELSVDINGTAFTASSTMPEPVPFDSLYLSIGPFGQHRFATISYRDPAGKNNAYRFVQYVNAVKEPTIYWENDEFTDGQTNILQLDVPADKKDDPRYIKSGDKVTIEMLCIDDPVLKYWYSLHQDGGTGSGSSAAPANPVTNISGGALGYFSAHTIQRREMTAP